MFTFYFRTGAGALLPREEAGIESLRVVDYLGRLGLELRRKGEA